MPRSARSEPALAEWAVLGLLCEQARHGWAVAKALAPEGEIGKIFMCTRPLVYRALSRLREAGLAEIKGAEAASGPGPARTIHGATRRGRSAFTRWRQSPVAHVRDLRSELMLKLLFHERASIDPLPLLSAQTAVLDVAETALAERLSTASGFDRTLVLWRLSMCRAARSFTEALTESRTAAPVVYHPIGYVSSPHTGLEGMPLQAIADTSGTSTIQITEAHRGCLADLEGFSHVWVVAHLHECTGWDASVKAFLDDRHHGTFATRSPRRPNAIGLSLAELVTVRHDEVVIGGIDLLHGTPVLDLKPYVPLFDAPPSQDVRFGWFEESAGRVFERTSDDRFAKRDRNG